MDAVHEAQETIDIGVCSDHNRVFECYCVTCYCMICPSCLMFDSHKGHPVCKIEEGAKDIRTKINNSAKEGSLKFEKTQNILLDIRHAKLSLDENAQNITKMSQKYFDDLIITIKARKAKFLEEIRKHYSEQIEFIDKTQQEWLKKQEISQKILKLQTSKDDIKIMQEASSIIHGLEDLSKPIEYKEIHLLESIDSNLNVGKHSYPFKLITDSFKQYLKKGRVIINRIKC